MNWQEQARNLWIERMVWIRQFIVSVMLGLRDLSYVASRTLRNGQEFGQFLAGFYGAEAGGRVENLFTQHVILLSEMASTVKAGGDIDLQRRNIYANADETIRLLNALNPYWDKTVLQPLVYGQFQVEEKLIHNLHRSQYAEGVELFDIAYDNALRAASLTIDGIRSQFKL